jgi:hypothetical protein
MNVKKICYVGGVVYCVYRMFLAYVTTATADPSAGLPKGKANKPCFPRDLKRNAAKNSCCSFCYAACSIYRCGASCLRCHRAKRNHFNGNNPVYSTSAEFYFSDL